MTQSVYDRGKSPFTLFCTLQEHYTEECPEKFAWKFKKRSAKCRTWNSYLTAQNDADLLSAIDDIRAR